MAGASSIPRSGASVASLLFAGLPKLSVPPSPSPPTFASGGISTSAVTSSPGSAPGDGGGSGGGLPAAEEEGGDADPPHLKRKTRQNRKTQGNRLYDDDIFGTAASIKKMRETAEAKAVMEDPMSMLLASRGMPLGISSASLVDKSRHLSKGGAGGSGGDKGNDSDEEDDKPNEKKEEAPFDMEALKEIFEQTAPAAAGNKKTDTWGTTKKGAEEIARHLVERNRGMAYISLSLLPLPDVPLLSRARETVSRARYTGGTFRAILRP